MANVTFEVHYTFDAAPQMVWNEMVDWKGHETWIPMTRVEVQPGDPTAVGAEFTAWTGLGPVSLKDHMLVTQCDWDDSTSRGRCQVEKLGPVLRGTAGFTLQPGAEPETTDLVWFEDVVVGLVPQFMAPLLAKLGAVGFKQGMGSLNKLMSTRRRVTVSSS